MGAEGREKRPYEAPAVRRLREIESGEGISQCATGSGDVGDCVDGNTAGCSCRPTGNAASYDCGSGNDGGA